MRTLRREDMEDLARGAAFLGTGGGGDPYVGRLMVEQVLGDGGVDVLSLDEIPDDALVIPTAMMGAPTVVHEKLPGGHEPVLALRRLEEHLGRTAYATMPVEIGGINSTIPLMVGAQTGLPVVDADGMGRAFPELQMETFTVHGVPGTPMTVCDEHGQIVIIEAINNDMMEWLARGVTIRMGGAAYIAEYPMDGATARRSSIPGTLSLAITIGRAIADARNAGSDPFDQLMEVLKQTPYKHGAVIFRGKITDVLRETTQGFASGHAIIEGLDDFSGMVMEIAIQNENLLARIDGELVAIVPDLICILDSETADPVTTEALKYGQRVTVMAVSVPELMRTPEALAVFGPAAFGLDDEFHPMEELWADRQLT